MHIRRFNRKSIVGRYAVMDGDKVVSRHQTSEQAETSRKLVEASLARPPSPQRTLVPAPSPQRTLVPAPSPPQQASLAPAPSPQPFNQWLVLFSISIIALPAGALLFLLGWLYWPWG